MNYDSDAEFHACKERTSNGLLLNASHYFRGAGDRLDEGTFQAGFWQNTRASPYKSPVQKKYSRLTFCSIKTIVLLLKKKPEGGYLMRINFQISGGFAYIPALSRPFVVDTELVDPVIAKELEGSVREARFFDHPANVGTVKKGAADYRTYTITVEDGARKHSIELTDPITDSNLQQLVSRLKKLSPAVGKG